jgi:hypothetical protein
VRRCASQDAPVGFAKVLEDAILVGSDDVRDAARALAQY